MLHWLNLTVKCAKVCCLFGAMDLNVITIRYNFVLKVCGSYFEGTLQMI